MVHDLVLVHGFSLDGRMWAPLAKALAPMVRVHAIDLPGCGASEDPPADSMDGMADAVQAFVTSRGMTRFSIGGLSMGGYVVLAWWRRHAAKVRPERLLLMHTRAAADSSDVRRQRDETARAVRKEGTLSLFADRMVPRLLSSQTPESVRAEVRRIIVEQRVETIAASSLAMRDRADATPILSSIDVPTLLLGGEEDTLTPPAEMASWGRAIPNAELTILRGAGHVSPMERPVECARELVRLLEA